MKKYRIPIIIFNLLLLLGYANFSILKKEKTLKEGQLILLELAPVDPRSLMQGDYMILRYAMTRRVRQDSLSKRGYCVVKLNEKNIAERIRFQEDETPLNKGEQLIKYTAANRGINIGAESFFFQEGQAEKYETAKYGGLRVDESGHSILVGLYDENQQEIK